jgi:hypothetical protein
MLFDNVVWSPPRLVESIEVAFVICGVK